MRRIDLHSHTTASDGSLSPRELVRLAREEGLSAIAITDHDTVAGISEALDEASSLGSIEVVAGIELSSYYGGDVHILGYGIDYISISLAEDLRYFRQIRNRRNEKMLERFGEIGIEISMADLLNESRGESIGRPHFASILLRRGIVDSFYSAFDKYLSEGSGICYVEKDEIHPRDVIELVSRHGGLSVLAHPMLLSSEVREDMRGFLTELKGYGLRGVEVYHPEHTLSDREFLYCLAMELELCVTGGSDFHGSLKPDVSLGRGRGDIAVPYDLLVSLFGLEKV